MLSALDLSARLNQAGRRLRQARDEEDWIRVLLDAAKFFCRRVALFQLAGERLRFRGARGGESPAGWAGTAEVAISAAPAFLAAVSSGDPVVLVHSAAELSEVIAGGLPAPAGSRVALLPVVTRERTVAILYAEAGEAPLDLNALELLTTLAGVVLEGRSSEPAGKPSGLGVLDTG